LIAGIVGLILLRTWMFLSQACCVLCR